MALINISRRQALFLGALAGLLLSKGLALVPAYSGDDYTALVTDRNVHFYLSQGRFMQAAIQYTLTALNVTPTSIAWPATILFFLCAASAISTGLGYLSSGRGSAILLAATGALIGAHPYLTEYFAFRESLITQGFSFFLLFVILLLAAHCSDNFRAGVRARYYHVAIPLLMTALAGTQQTAFLILGFFLLARVFLEVNGIVSIQAQAGFELSRSTRFFVVYYFSAFIIYALVYYFLREFVVPVRVDDRGAIISLAQAGERVDKVFSLIKKVLVFNEPLIALPTKYYILAMVLLGVLFNAQRPRLAIGIIVMFLLMILGAVSLVSISGVWWPAPRAIYGFGFAIGLAICISSLTLSRPFAAIYAAAVAVGGLILSFHSSAILHDQIRVNRWDMWAAGQIAAKLSSEGITSETQVFLVGAPWGRPSGPRTVEGDLNISAFAIPWAAGPLIIESTGMRWKARSIRTNPECDGIPTWPHPDSVRRSGKDVYLCMGGWQ